MKRQRELFVLTSISFLQTYRSDLLVLVLFHFSTARAKYELTIALIYSLIKVSTDDLDWWRCSQAILTELSLKDSIFAHCEWRKETTAAGMARLETSIERKKIKRFDYANNARFPSSSVPLFLFFGVSISSTCNKWSFKSWQLTHEHVFLVP